jgi:hypothetical protein
MDTIDQAASHVACREYVRQARDPHKWIRVNTAMPLQCPWQHCCERTCSHAYAPNDRLRGDDLTRSKRDTGSIDGGDFGPQSCLDAKAGERLANYRTCVSSDCGSYDRTVIDEDYPVLSRPNGAPKLARHLGRNLDASEARTHDHHS